MSSLGYGSLVVALAVAFYGIIASLRAARKGGIDVASSSHNAVIAVFVLVSLSSLVLLIALLTHDFKFSYVASYSSRDMSLLYILTAFWAGNAGSLLFWAWLLSVFILIVLIQNRKKQTQLLPYLLAVAFTVEAFFLVLLVFVADPFKTLALTPADGRGMNPLLENLEMVFHPSALLGGYVGLTVPFAFALAALAARKLDDEWLKTVRNWTLLSWFLLGVGNILGAQWAYVELGWGGYWGWDPVENAGLLPWLTSTAFLHSMMMQKRYGMLKVWNILLIMFTFLLTILGTYLTRSSVLSSVHSFGETSLDPFFIGFLVMWIVICGGLLTGRMKELKSEEEIDAFVSRESTFLLNNLILISATLAILWGTIFPLFTGTTPEGNRVAVTPDYFNRVVGPIFMTLILLLGLCTLVGWRKTSPRKFLSRLAYPLTAAVLLIVVQLILGISRWYVVLAFSVCGFVLVGVLFQWLKEVGARRKIKKVNFGTAWWGLITANKPRYGAYIVHLGIVLMAVGIIGSSFFQVEKTASLARGESLNIEDYTLTFQDMTVTEIPNRQIYAVTLEVSEGGQPVGTLVPEKSFHRNFEQPVTEVAIRSTWREDLYVILAAWDEKNATFKVLVNPLVMWLWVGGGLFVIGTVIAFLPKSKAGQTPRGEKD